LYFLPPTTITRENRDKENETTLHVANLLRQQSSLLPTDSSASHAHFAIWVLSSTILRDDNNITARIASATALMGALKEIWRNPHINIYNKYLLFRAIPMNLLLWGAET
jgi:hypothetical protein